MTTTEHPERQDHSRRCQDNANLVSVVIVNFNGGMLLTDCVHSVLASTVPLEVLVSDNGSTDKSIDFLKRSLDEEHRVRIIENGKNLGFARANNTALPMTSGNFLLFLNPDCIIRPDTLERMLAVMAAQPETGMAGCLIRNLDGSEQPGCRRYVPTPWRSFVRVFKLSRIFSNQPRFSSFILTGQPLPDGPSAVEAISGAFMFVRRSAVEKVGPLDEKYFLHCEDLDWCVRFQRAGFPITFVPDVEIVHAKGVGSAGRPIKVEWHKHKGMIRFYQKFFRSTYPTALMFMVILAVWIRFATIASTLAIGNAFRNRPQQPVATPLPDPDVPAADRIAPPSLPGVIITGATSQIGHFLLPKLREAGYAVHAVSRKPPGKIHAPDDFLVWHKIDVVNDAESLKKIRGAEIVIYLAPLATLCDSIDTLIRMNIRRIMAFGSTSRYSKLASADPEERKFVRKLIEAENVLEKKCTENGIAWTLFRPTLIYGCGIDKNVTTIANFIQRFGFFPILGNGKGLRQPVHAEDLAAACLAALNCPAARNKAYNLSGGETLSYRQMVQMIFEALGKKPRIIKIPLSLFTVLLKLSALLPAYRHLNIEMVNRIGLDLNFDHLEARRDFGYSPRGFMFFAGTRPYHNDTRHPTAAGNG